MCAGHRWNALVLLPLFSAALVWPQDSGELYRQAMRLFSERQGDAALAALQKSVALDPANAQAWKALGVVFASRGEFERAETPFHSACERQPSLQDACLYYGRTLYLLNRFEPAMAALRRAIAAQNTAEAHRLLALSLEALGRTGDAGSEFKTALGLARGTPADEDPGIDYGVYLFRLGQPDQALLPLLAALQRHPDSARAHLELGCILLALDRLSDAATHLERSVALNPQSSRAHLLLGKTYLRLGKNEAAEEHLRQGSRTVR
jgi:Tfp pilus assembly protein PilF